MTRAQITEALQQSITHWQRLAEGRPIPGEGPFQKDCPLCALFVDLKDPEGKSHCLGCPVYMHTKRTYCGNTPYASAYDAYGFDTYSKQFMEAAEKELIFLNMLLYKYKK
jgi:hypothetical protein